MIKNYKWQEEAIEQFSKDKKMIAEVATGAGKTFFAIQTIKKLLEQEPSLKVLIVSPKIVILDNWNTELQNNGFVFTDIGFYYGEMKNYSKITLTTNASISKVNLDLFDYLIVDEIHNTFTTRFKSIYSMNWKYILGLTATLNNDDETKHYEFLKFFNFNCFRFTMKEALKNNIINSFVFHERYFSLNHDIITREKYQEIEDKIRNLIRSRGSYYKVIKSKVYAPILYNLIDKRNKIVYMYPDRFKILEKILKDNYDKKIIIFNEYNAAAREIYLRCLDLDLSARVVNSDLDSNRVKTLINEYKNNKYNILITSKMFDEGYNLPAIDVAIIFSGDSTKRQFIQRMGRTLRKKEEMSKVYQIYCENTFDENYAEKRRKIIEDVMMNE